MMKRFKGGSVIPKSITIQIGKFKNEYELHITMAPKEYDLPSTMVVLIDMRRRYILISCNAIDEQLQKYNYGDYITTACDNSHVIEYACDKLFMKLFKEN